VVYLYLLLIAGNVDKDLKQLRRVVEDARDAVASQQHQDGGPPKPDVPTLPSMNPQAVRTLLLRHLHEVALRTLLLLHSTH
jgi:hypothetical protein